MEKIYIMTDKEAQDASTWIKGHKCSLVCNRLHSFTFTPTGIGTSVKVSCNCGKSKDVTDVSDW
jgi:hypothetical protein